MHPREGKIRLNRLWVCAIWNSVNMLVAGASTAVALVFGSWWLLLSGLLVCVVFTIYTISRPQFRRALAASARMLRLSDVQDVNDLTLQRLSDAFTSGRNEVESLLAQLPKEVKRYLGTAITSLDELEHCAARLVLRAQELTSLLRIVSRSTLEEEVHRLYELAQRSGSRETRDEYEDVLGCQRQQAQVIGEVTQAIDRAVASLVRTVVLVKELPAQLVGLRLIEAQLKDSMGGDLEELWERIHGELRTSEQTLRGLDVWVPTVLPNVLPASA